MPLRTPPHPRKIKHFLLKNSFVSKFPALGKFVPLSLRLGHKHRIVHFVGVCWEGLFWALAELGEAAVHLLFKGSLLISFSLVDVVSRVIK